MTLQLDTIQVSPLPEKNQWTKEYNKNNIIQTYTFSHEGKTLRSVIDSFYHHYQDLRENVTNTILKRPDFRYRMATFAELVSFFHAAHQNAHEKHSKDVLNNLKSYFNYSSTCVLYAPREGAYIHDTPEIKDGQVEIVKNDSQVRFVPFGYEISNEVGALSKNPLIVSLAGKEGAEKIQELSKRYAGGDDEGYVAFASFDNFPESIYNLDSHINFEKKQGRDACITFTTSLRTYWNHFLCIMTHYPTNNNPCGQSLMILESPLEART